MLFHYMSLLILTVCQTVLSSKPPFFILVGDSTVAANGGWGNGLLSYLVGGAGGINKAIPGTTTKSFFGFGRWDGVIGAIVNSTDDYEPIVTIQFGHNDLNKGLTIDEYRANLVRMIAEIEDVGGTPVIITSLSRRVFNDGHAVQDLAQQRIKAIDAAESANVQYVDLNYYSERYIDSIGEANSQYYNYVEGDQTHVNIAGQTVFSQLVVDLWLTKRRDLNCYFKKNHKISAKLTAGEFATGSEE